MLKNNFLIIVLCQFFLLTSFSPSFSQTQQKNEDRTTLPSRTLNDNGTSYVDVEYTFNGVNISEIKVSGNTFHFFNVEGFSKMGEIGKPALPAHDDFIAVPENASPVITILDADFKEFSGYMAHPALSPALDTEGSPEPKFVIDKKTYNTNKYFPENLSEIVEIQKLRGTPIAIVQIRPVQFNPVTKKIRVYSKIKYRIDFIGNNKSFEKIGIENTSHFTDFMKGIVLNNKSIPSGKSPLNLAGAGQRKDYIIITNTYFSDAADTLAKWKRQMGYSVEIIAKASWTASQVKDSIHNRYHNWLPHPDYFVILGDHTDVPADEFQTGNPPTMYGTDLYFACMDGSSDYYPDMAHGRISIASVIQAIAVVQKIVNYERYPYADTSFYNNGLNCAQYQDNDTNSFADRRFCHTSENVRDYLTAKNYNVQRVYYANNTVTPQFYNNGYYSPDSLPIPSVLLKSNGFQWNGGQTEIVNAINEGKFYVLHRDHGYVGGSGWAHPYFTKNSLNLLSNGNKLPVVFSVNCHTGEFTLSECFAERFLRLGNGGTVGVFAASHASYSGYNDGLTIGFFDAIWSNPGMIPNFGSGGVNNPNVSSHQDILTMGDVLNHGLLRMRQTWSGSGNGHRHQHRLFQYFGDPAMKIFTTLPIPILANHPDTLIVGSTSLLVTNSTCPNALATIYYDGVLFAKAQLVNGIALLNFNPLNDTSLTTTLTLSKENFRPYIAEIVIANYGNPLNDEPCDAIELSVNKYCNPYLSDNNGATSTSGIAIPVCGNYNGADVWFMAVVPQSGMITIESDTALAGFNDGAMAVYSGTCSSLTFIECDDNDGLGNMPKIELTNKIPGDTLFIRFWQNGGTQTGSFNICAYEPDTLPYADLPYFTGFENGFDQYWFTHSADSNGRIIIDTNCVPYNGNANLMMDVVNAGNYCKNESWLRLNLDGKSNVKLKFWWREFGDENHSNDGIFFSNDGGNNFVKVVDMYGSWNDWTQYIIDVDRLSQEHGLTFTNVFVIKFQQYDNWYMICNNPGGGDGFAFDDISVYVDSSNLSYASLPYNTGFENGFDNYWTHESSTKHGRTVITSTKIPHSGNKHLTMDVATGGNYTINRAYLHLNLLGESNVQFNFWWKDFGDENHNEDGIYFSDDGGNSFLKVFTLQDTSHFWMQKNLNVDNLSQTYNLNLTNNFVIKIQQYDNYSIGSDGFAFDDINIASSVMQPYIYISPYSFNFKVDTAKTAYDTTYVINSGNDTLFVQSSQIQSPFTISPTNYFVLPGDTQKVAIDFSPDSVMNYFEMATLVTNSTAGTDSIFVFGLGMHRRIFADTNFLDFDSLFINDIDTMKFYIVAEGNGRINVSDIAVPTGFEVISKTSFNIDPDDSVRVKVKFKPLSNHNYSGNIIVTSNANNLSIPISGIGYPSSIEEMFSANLLTVFPNPTKDNVTFIFDKFLTNDVKINFYNVLGIQVKSCFFNNSKKIIISLNDLNNGIYFYSVEKYDIQYFKGKITVFK